jgi:hypothetical protein
MYDFVIKECCSFFLPYTSDGACMFTRSVCSHIAPLPLPFGNSSTGVNSILPLVCYTPLFFSDIFVRCVPCHDVKEIL